MNDSNADDLDLLSDEETIPEAGVPWKPGHTFTVLDAMSINVGRPLVYPSYVYVRGSVVTITADTIEFQGWLLALIDDEAEQLSRWGKVRLRRGTHHVEPWEKYGDPVWEIHEREARRIALAQIEPADRRAALEKVAERFGPHQTPRGSSFTYTHTAALRREADERAAQQERRTITRGR